MSNFEARSYDSRWNGGKRPEATFIPWFVLACERGWPDAIMLVGCPHHGWYMMLLKYVIIVGLTVRHYLLDHKLAQLERIDHGLRCCYYRNMINERPRPKLDEGQLYATATHLSTHHWLEWLTDRWSSSFQIVIRISFRCCLTHQANGNYHACLHHSSMFTTITSAIFLLPKYLLRHCFDLL